MAQLASGLVAATLVFLGACAVTPPPPLVPAESSEEQPPGTIRMAANGTLTIINFPDSAIPDPRPLVIRPGEHPEAYRGYVELVDGLVPGQTKPLRSYVGNVRMNEDRSLTVAWRGGGHADGLIAEPYQEMLLPGDARYDELIERVGGLSPGQRKGIRP